ncbi:flavin-containing monooxygenase Ecym_2416 [Eremothecium cymbalariae DBVPG|uniref:FAD/NAD(P)-binding domain-containing protein n=1 Tax=Eremothecium cymbalariae (strain CBS 270.75 / DBVPG 7215 / KCTC 17166 / NRRL Y-17582) TaxID=931890 RepID=G8JP90_ERECY|nr:Hypothetical protein Ecym_2416 [Eremothecium cymbalariae DBVPG\
MSPPAIFHSYDSPDSESKSPSSILNDESYSPVKESHSTKHKSEKVDYYNNEIYPPITKHSVDYDLPESKVYGEYKACPALIQNTADSNLKPLVKNWLLNFNNMLNDVNAGIDSRKTASELENLFTNHASWRDHLALSWDFHSFNGLRELKKRICPLLVAARLKNVKLDDLADYHYKQGFGKIVIHDQTPEQVPIEWIQVYFSFDNKVGNGKGVARLVAVEDEETGLGILKCFTFYTVLEDLKSNPERTFRNRPEGVKHGYHPGRESWAEQRARETRFSRCNQPTVLIVGGGQGGLSIAARLKSFGITSVIVEKNSKVGDNWRNRYKFLVLHDPILYDEMPYMSFPPTWPIYTSKDKLADWFDSYVKSLDLNVRCKATVTGASFDECRGKWKVEVTDNKTGDITYYRPQHLIMATGHSGEPRIPQFPGQEKFEGKVIHSSQYNSGVEFRGGKVLVVGSCSSAHDICQDLYEQGAKVTMLQRSSTCIITAKHGTAHNNKGLYDEDGPKIETADHIFHSMPLSLLNGVMQQQYRASCKDDADLLAGLNEVGFKTNAGFNGTGLFGLYFRIGSGYYIDVGCSTLISNGKVKLKQGVSLKRFTKTGVEFTDGTKLEDLDAVILATGFTNMKETARRLFGQDVASRLRSVWGLDEEGEFKTMWRDSGHPNFWFMGGNLALARYYSKRLALRIVAQEMQIKY